MQRDKCPICNEDNITKLNQPDHRTISQCSYCGHVFASEYSETELEELYKSMHYKSADDPWIEEWAAKNREVWLGTAKNIKQHLKQEASVMDVGAGTGGFLQVLHEQEPTLNIYADESSPEARASLQKRLPFLTILDQPFLFLNPDDQQFDIIAMLQFLEHVNDPCGYIGQAHQLLKPGGVLLITIPNRGGLETKRKGFEDVHNFGNPTHINFFAKKDANQMMHQAGYSTYKRIINFGGAGGSFGRKCIQFGMRLWGASSELRYLAVK